MHAIIATVLFGLAAACSPAPVPSSAPSDVLVSTSPSSAAPVFSSSPDQAGWLPPWGGAATPKEVVARTVLPFCGVEEGGFAGLINAEVRGCFVAALRDGSGAEFASIRSTIEGDPIATITRVLPGGGLEVLIDSTQDAFGARVWTRTVCRGSVEDQKLGFIPEGCDEAVVIR